MDDLEAAYFKWLYPQVIDTEHRNRPYEGLLMLLYFKEFVWTVPNDDNRIEDGLEIRREFLATQRTRYELTLPCSFLEVLIGLSRRLEFQTDGTAEGWAWQLLVNLELHRMADPLSRRKQSQVDEILEAVIWRTYNPDGSGGFFPLGWPEEDQTKVEIWYQMAHYVNEMHPDY
jgi:hypothetical protein